VSTNTIPLISVVDDDESVREAIEAFMKTKGFKVRAFPSSVDFLASARIEDTSCMIADINMPNMTGVELHGELTRRGFDIPTILITAYPDDAVRARALADGVIGYLSKPFDEDALLACIRSALTREAER
jgi:FixJ family two-component response regulator